MFGRGEDQAEGAAGDVGGVDEVGYQPGEQDTCAQGQSAPLGQPGPGTVGEDRGDGDGCEGAHHAVPQIEGRERREGQDEQCT
ncbi:hypothetical protein SBI_02807 [Streptomyces bingchenggensis BCW-1]|uniref:Uncharacterized protein n=1 Tax=Streptomyces bingchenggensis (strain BCW-1) TaxID=749414 RepID=D7C2P5_STRBB|nr:hypothetical protein SBI_02807 [Streptomyces bingchenggensis BCW-1]